MYIRGKIRLFLLDLDFEVTEFRVQSLPIVIPLWLARGGAVIEIVTPIIKLNPKTCIQESYSEGEESARDEEALNLIRQLCKDFEKL